MFGRKIEKSGTCLVQVCLMPEGAEEFCKDLFLLSASMCNCIAKSEVEAKVTTMMEKERRFFSRGKHR